MKIKALKFTTELLNCILGPSYLAQAKALRPPPSRSREWQQMFVKIFCFNRSNTKHQNTLHCHS